MIYDIFKYDIGSYGATMINLPRGTQFLSGDLQQGQSVVWLKVPRESDSKEIGRASCRERV